MRNLKVGIGRITIVAALALITVLGCTEVTGPLWVDGLRIKPDSLFLLPGESGTLTAVPFDQNDDPLPDRGGRVEWATSSSIATIEQPGDGSAVVTALRAGSTNVRASLGRGTKTGRVYIEPEAVAEIRIEPAVIEIGVSGGFGSGATVRAVILDASGNEISPAGYRISWRVSNPGTVRLGTGQEVLTGVSTSVRGRQLGTSTISLQVGARQVVGTITVR